MFRYRPLGRSSRTTPITATLNRLGGISQTDFPRCLFSAPGYRLFLVVVWILLPLWMTADADRIPADIAPLARQSLLLDGVRAGTRLIVVGDRGHILLSDDEAISWTQVPSPTQVLLTAIHMYDENTGWIVGHDAVILRTTDGGQTWDLVHAAPQEERPLLDVWFRDRHNGFAIGAYGYFLSTSDGGQTWTSRPIGDDDYHLNVLTAFGTEQLFIGAEAGRVYRSDDGGTHWQAVASPYPGSWFGALALSRNTVLLAGLRGALYRSQDGGANWEQIMTPTTATLTSSIALPSGALLFTGLEGILLVSHDQGHHVTLKPFAQRIGISTALPLSDGDLLLIGERGLHRLSGNP